MRWLRPSLAVLGAALLVIASIVRADYNVQDKGSYYSNAQTGLRTNSTGDLRVDDMNRNRDYVVKYDDIINDTISIGTADSTLTLLDTHDVGRGYLMISASGFAAGAAIPFVRLAIRVTGHTNSQADSATTFNFDFNPNWLSTTDSLSFGNATIPTSVAFGGTEAVATISYDAAAASKYARRATIIVPIKDTNGDWFWSEYTGIMVRVLSANANTPRIRVSYRGTPL